MTTWTVNNSLGLDHDHAGRKYFLVGSNSGYGGCQRYFVEVLENLGDNSHIAIADFNSSVVLTTGAQAEQKYFRVYHFVGGANLLPAPTQQQARWPKETVDKVVQLTKDWLFATQRAPATHPLTPEQHQQPLPPPGAGLPAPAQAGGFDLTALAAALQQGLAQAAQAQNQQSAASAVETDETKPYRKFLDPPKLSVEDSKSANGVNDFLDEIADWVAIGLTKQNDETTLLLHARLAIEDQKLRSLVLRTKPKTLKNFRVAVWDACFPSAEEQTLEEFNSLLEPFDRENLTLGFRNFERTLKNLQARFTTEELFGLICLRNLQLSSGERVAVAGSLPKREDAERGRTVPVYTVKNVQGAALNLLAQRSTGSGSDSVFAKTTPSSGDQKKNEQPELYQFSPDRRRGENNNYRRDNNWRGNTNNNFRRENTSGNNNYWRDNHYNYRRDNNNYRRDNNNNFRRGDRNNRGSNSYERWDERGRSQSRGHSDSRGDRSESRSYSAGSGRSGTWKRGSRKAHTPAPKKKN